MMTVLRIVAVSFWLGIPALLFAAGGTVRGYVRSAEDSSGVSGASVAVKGTILGGMTDANGEFILANVPAGVYTLSVSMIGFTRKNVRGVSVAGDSTTSINIFLGLQPVQTQPVIITAAKHEQTIDEVPSTIAVMGADMIRHRNIVTMDEALRYIPGVNMTQWQINIRGSSGYARGVGSRVLVLLDGIPFLTGDTGEISLESLPVVNIDRVEVVKGAGSALYGSNALGGVINIITKEIGSQPVTTVKTFGSLYDRPLYPEWRWSSVSRGQAGLYLTHSRRFDRLAVTVSADRMVDDGYRQNDYARRWDLYAKASYDFTPFTRWTLSTNVFSQRTGSFLFWQDIEHALQPQPDQLGQHVWTTRANVSSDFQTLLTPGLAFTVKSMWYRTNWQDNIGTIYNGDVSVTDLFENEFQIGSQIDSRQYLTAGIDTRYDHVDANVFGKRQGRGAALYVQDEYYAGSGVRITAGARYDYQKIDSLSVFSHFNPKLAMTWTLSDGVVARASVGSGYREPTVSEAFTVTTASGLRVIPNPALQAERSWSYETGVSARVMPELVVDAALFMSDFWNLIEPRFVVIRGESYGQFNNVTRARTTGGEIHLQSSLIHNILKADLSYTYVWPRDLTQHDILKYRPRHLLIAGIEATMGAWSAGIDSRFISKVDRIDEEFVTLNIVKDGDLRVPIYVTDARISFETASAGLPVRFTFNAYNIFQYYYTELIGNIAPVRRFSLTLESAF